MMWPELISQWKQWHRFWSSRVTLLAAGIQAVALGAEIGGAFIHDWRWQLAVGMVGILFTLSAIYARVLFQDSLSEPEPKEKP